jgi:alanine-synthesizing transaminase
MQPIQAAKRTDGVRYAIRDVVMKAREHANQGMDMLYLNIGDPIQFDFQTPRHIVDAISKSMNDGNNGYGPSEGTVESVDAVTREAHRKGIKNPHHVFLTTGASEAIELAMTALLDPGDELLVPSPGYPLYTALLSKLSAKGVAYELDEDNGWQPNIEDIERSITPTTKGLVIINPNNPTGAIAKTDTLDRIVELAKRHNLLLLSDEIYDKLTLDGQPLVSLASRAGDHPCVTFGGVAKCYLGPGLRVGWGVVSGRTDWVDEYSEAIGRLERARLCASHPAQASVKAALDGPQDHIDDMLVRLTDRRDRLMAGIDAIDGISCVPPQGAFYAFPRLHGVADDNAFVMDLMAATGIVCVPGSGFGQKENTAHLRFVILPPPAIIDTAMERLADFMNARR